MPKFNLDINGVGAGAAEGREAWSGELPPTGSYQGLLKVLSVDVIGPEAKNAGKPRLRVGVELRKTPGGKYDGYLAWGSLNLIDSSIPFVNQFLWALTDGSDSQKTAVEKAFYDAGPVVDERKKHVLKIGKLAINSPEGELPVKISLSNKPFFNPKTQQTTQQVRIESYLAGGGFDGAVATGKAQEAPEEESVVELDDESILDDEEVG